MQSKFASPCDNRKHIIQNTGLLKEKTVCENIANLVML